MNKQAIALNDIEKMITRFLEEQGTAKNLTEAVDQLYECKQLLLSVAQYACSSK